MYRHDWGLVSMHCKRNPNYNGDRPMTQYESTTSVPLPMPKVYAAIHAVLVDLSTEGVAKGRKNQQQGFSFRGVDDIYQALSPLLAKHNLFLAPIATEASYSERATKSGGTMYAVRLTVKYSVFSSLDGSSIEVETTGEAMDSGDKATSKALSMAFKYLAFQLFCIPLEGVPDADEETPPPSSPVQKPRDTVPAEVYETYNEAMQAIDKANTPADLQRVGVSIGASNFQGEEQKGLKGAYAAKMKWLQAQGKAKGGEA